MRDEGHGGADRLLSAMLPCARRLVSAALPAERREFILGDLEELHHSWVERDGRRAADRRYLKALFGSVAARRDRRAPTRRPEPSPGRRGRIGADLVTDFRHASRALGRQPGFVVVVAATLGLGVGAAGAVFGLVNQLLLRPLPGIHDPGGSAFLEFSTPDRRSTGISGPLAEEIRESATLLEGLATFDYVPVHVSAEGRRPLEVRAYTVFGDYFELLGVRPAAGRLLSASETGRQADPYVAVISERLWAQLFAKSANVIGQQFQANGHAFTVLGVAAGDFSGTNRGWDVDLWVPRSAFVPLEGYPSERLWSRDSRLNQEFLIRPRPEVAFEAAEAELNAILRGLAEAEPADRDYVSTLEATVHPGLNLAISLRQRVLPSLGILGVAGILILLIPCANVANLLLVKAINSRGDVAVRRALGASAGRIARRAIMESFLLAAVGTVAGLGVAWLIGLTVKGQILFGLPGFEGFVVDWRVTAFACAAVFVTALLSGTAPAILTARFDPGSALRDAGRQHTRRHGPLRYGMSILQIALSLTLLIGGVLLARTVRNVYALDPGLNVDGVYIASIDMGQQPIQGAERSVFQRYLLSSVEDVGGVRAAALQSFYGPYMGGSLMSGIATLPDGETVWVAALWVSPGWFEFFEIDPVRGRTFRAADRESTARPPVILTSALAHRLFRRSDVVGRTVWVGAPTLAEAEVVGVVGDLRMDNLHSPPDEAFFLPHARDRSNRIAILARVAGTDSGTRERFRRAVESVAPQFPVPEPETLRARIDRQLTEQRVLARLLGVFSGLAVLLAAVGLYGVIAFGVTGRRREFAIRLALGADGARIANLVFRSAAAVILSGTALGLLGAFGLSTMIESRLFGVEAVDAGSYLGAAGLLALVAAAACWFPARAALRVDPVATLRQE
jgi:putative ABC transport system permease protein